MYYFFWSIPTIFIIYHLLKLYLYCEKIKKIKINMLVNIYFYEYNKFLIAKVIRINNNFVLPFRTFDVEILNADKLNIVKIHEDLNSDEFYF